MYPPGLRARRRPSRREVSRRTTIRDDRGNARQVPLSHAQGLRRFRCAGHSRLPRRSRKQWTVLLEPQPVRPWTSQSPGGRIAPDRRHLSWSSEDGHDEYVLPSWFRAGPNPALLSVHTSLACASYSAPRSRTPAPKSKLDHAEASVRAGVSQVVAKAVHVRASRTRPVLGDGEGDAKPWVKPRVSSPRVPVSSWSA